MEMLTETLDVAVNNRKKHRADFELAQKKQMEYETKPNMTRSKTGVFYDNGVWKMDWHAAPAYMAKYQPDEEDPCMVYTNLRHLLLERTLECEHNKIVNLIMRYR